MDTIQSSENTIHSECPNDPEEGKEFKLQKKKNNGVIYALYWHIGMLLVRFFKMIRLTPNQVTIIGFGLVMLCGYFLLRGDYASNVTAGILLFLAMLMDGIDGKLARLSNKTSNLGVWLDYNCDFLRPFFVYPPIAYAIYKTSGSFQFIPIAFIILTVMFLRGILSLKWITFPFAMSEKKKYFTKSKLHLILKQFYSVYEIEALALPFFALMNRLDYFMYLFLAYHSLYYLGFTFKLAFVIRRHDKIDKDHKIIQRRAG